MSSNTLSSQSRIRVCWMVWLVILVCVLLLRFMMFALASQYRFAHLTVIYALITWLPIMALHYVDWRRLNAHLKTHHQDKWKYLTWAFGAPGRRNSFRMLPWLFSAEDYGDHTLAQLKSEHRQLLLFTLVVFVSYPLLTPILGA